MAWEEMSLASREFAVDVFSGGNVSLMSLFSRIETAKVP
jgi:hypothetical protein